MASLDTEENYVHRWLEEHALFVRYPALHARQILACERREPVLTSRGWRMRDTDTGEVLEEDS